MAVGLLASRGQVIAALASHVLLLPPLRAVADTPPPFTKTSSGLQYSDFKVGSGPAVKADSRVTFHVVGRLVGRQGRAARMGL